MKLGLSRGRSWGRPRGIWLALYLLAAGGLFAADSWRWPSDEWDEIVYLHLSERMTWGLRDYTVRGSWIDEALPHPVYSAEVFYHPPTVPYLIRVLSVISGPDTAARLLNLGLYVLSLWLVYALTARFSDPRGGAYALLFWTLCPIHNLEARHIHLDYPLTVLLLLGIWGFVREVTEDRPPRGLPLAASALALALAMLCKITGPLFMILPALLVASRWSRLSRSARTVFIAVSLGFGFLWWAFLLVRFGGLVPPGSVARAQDLPRLDAYQESLLGRHWYDLILYFAAMFPLVALYLAGLLPRAWRIARSRGSRAQVIVDRDGLLTTLNIALIASTILVAAANAVANGMWVFRFFMPLLPVLYVTTGVAVTRRMDGPIRTRVPVLFLTAASLVLLGLSTYVSLAVLGNLKPIPVLYFWLGLGEHFF